MSAKSLSAFVQRDRERKATARMVRFYEGERLPVGVPFEFRSKPGVAFVKDEGGTIMQLAKFNARRVRS